MWQCDQDKNKQGKDYKMFTFFLLFDLFVGFEKIEPESLQIFNHILIVTFSDWFQQIFLSLQAFLMQLVIFSLSGSWGRNTVNFRNCEFSS